MDIRQIFATNLRRLRGTRSVSQEELADLAEIDRTYVSLLERCKYSASLDVIGRIAHALEIDPAELLKPLPPRPRNRGQTTPSADSVP